ncbi:unnamed protein product [Lymnaea stagnalis]|uniref:39S ribosomal protein L41, mitochondrial n=1 Tax=Lymnaea stagnalis TaxID=6523 RepID=A0AAV2IFD9_LYMST
MLQLVRAQFLQCTRRSITTSSCLCGKKTRKPWDQRFPVSVEDVSPDVKGGSVEMAEALPEKIVAPTGIYHKLTKKYIHVPEMVPEFVVPDLTGFELKPYVSYKAKEISQAPLTPREIFDSYYAQDIEDDFLDGKIKFDAQKVFLGNDRQVQLEEYIEIVKEKKT